jgi:hypothetical protein
VDAVAAGHCASAGGTGDIMTAQPAKVFRTLETLSGDELAIARSVLYASLFDYPLTLAQLRQTLIEAVMTPTQILSTYRRSEALRLAVGHQDRFFFPAGRADLIDERRRREARSRRFLLRHRRLLAIICALPFVRMVALSGSVAHLNLDGDGDLDLFIVTRGQHVWSITVAVIVIAKLLRRRRTVCANFVVSDERLALEQRDLFTASQVVHLKPVIGREVFLQLVTSNPFIHQLYPNFYPSDPPLVRLPARRTLEGTKRLFEWVLAVPSAAVEALTRRAYRAYLTRQASSWTSPEQVRLEDDYLKLHTHSHRQSVMERFEEAVLKLEVKTARTAINDF